MLINEDLAKRSKENYSFHAYKAGSATSEYNEVIAEATEQIEKAKLRVSDEGKVRLDKLLETYSFKYATWINKSNANGSKHVSVMIAGPSGYDMKQHNRYMARQDVLMKEYNEMIDIGSKIYSIVRGDKIIKSGDVNALDKLKEKLLKAQEEHQGYKDFNIKAKKEGNPRLMSYVLTNSNARMKGIKNRIAKLERIQADDSTSKEIEINDIKIIDNVEANRLQIIFKGKPDPEVRAELKKNGFRWSPTNSAWQRYRSEEAIKVATRIVEGIA